MTELDLIIEILKRNPDRAVQVARSLERGAAELPGAVGARYLNLEEDVAAMAAIVRRLGGDNDADL